MNCKRCSAELPQNALFCPFCGRPVHSTQTKKKRGNGQGTIIKTKSGKYKAVVTLGYYLDGDRLRRKTRSKVFDKRTDAANAIPSLLATKADEKTVTFQQLYERWIPTHRAGKDTLNCYKAAFKYFKPLYPLPLVDIDVDDLQECIDDCPHGKRTKENMRAVAGLMYKYGIPRHLIPDGLNLGPFLKVDGDAAAHREAFNDIQLAKIKKACETNPQAKIIYIMCYLGFRPSEFLNIRVEDIDLKKDVIVGGAKTEAGKGRLVTISPKIKTMLEDILPAGGYLIGGKDKPLRQQYFTEVIFYPTLEAIGIDNPMVEIAGGKLRHKYSPHSCRHTFATLMKRVTGADKDKQELIGHASAEMLRYYQDVDLTDLKAITDAI